MSSHVDLSQLAVTRTAPTKESLRRRRNFGGRYVLPAIILGAFTSLAIWSLRDSLLPARSVTVTPVIMAQADVQPEGTPLFQAAGWIEPRPTATTVSAQVEGIVEELLVVEGQEVEEGEPLARLIAADAVLALRDAESVSMLREAELDLAQATLAAARQTLKQPVHLEAALAEAEAARAKVTTELRNLPFLLTAAEARASFALKDLEGKRTLGDAIAQRTVQRSQSEHDTAVAGVNELRERSINLEAESKALQQRCEALQRQLELRTAEHRNVAESAASCKAAEARLEQSRVAIDTAKLRLKRMNILSPMRGQVLTLHARPGRKLSGLSPGSESDSSNVVSLYDPTMLQVRADVRLEDVSKVHVGQSAVITLAAMPDELSGEVIGVTSSADIQKNTLQVKVAIIQPPAVIKPEMLVQVSFLAPETLSSEASKTSDPLRQLVPRELVMTSSSGSSVWIADLAQSSARLRSVELGKAGTDLLVEVTKGLTPTDKLIVTGRDELSDGQRIRVMSEDRSLGSPRVRQSLDRPASAVLAKDQ